MVYLFYFYLRYQAQAQMNRIYNNKLPVYRRIGVLKLYDKRDDLSFLIVHFPFICSNIPAAPVLGVYISQLIRYFRSYGSYQDFLGRGLTLTMKLLNQAFILNKLKSNHFESVTATTQTWVVAMEYMCHK